MVSQMSNKLKNEMDSELYKRFIGLATCEWGMMTWKRTWKLRKTLQGLGLGALEQELEIKWKSK